MSYFLEVEGKLFSLELDAELNPIVTLEGVFNTASLSSDVHYI